MEVLYATEPEECGFLAEDNLDAGELYLPFIVDSGATSHFVGSDRRLINVEKLKDRKIITGINKDKSANINIEKMGNL